MDRLLAELNETTIILLSLSIMLLAGFLLTRITKLAKLPNVTGYILAGVLIGPYVLNVIPSEMVANMGFISDIALAFIAFGVGRFFQKRSVSRDRLRGYRDYFNGVFDGRRVSYAPDALPIQPQLEFLSSFRRDRDRNRAR